jgi:hypothetical protein
MIYHALNRANFRSRLFQTSEERVSEGGGAIRPGKHDAESRPPEKGS